MMYSRRRQGASWSIVLGAFGLGVAVTLAASPLLAVPVAEGLSSILTKLGRASAPTLSEESQETTAETMSSAASASHFVDEGTLAMQAGRWQEALHSFERALEIDQREPLALARGARSLLYLNRLADGLRWAKQAYEVAPGSAESNRVLAQALDWNLQYDAAIAAATRAIAADPLSAEAHALLAEALTDAYRLREADEAVTRALDLDPRHPDAHRVRGYLAESQADYTTAIEQYQQAVSLAPGYSYLHLSLGHALRAARRYDEARPTFVRASELNRQDPRPYGGLGMVAYALEDYEGAIGYLRQAVAIDQHYVNGHAQLAWVFYVQKQYEQALPYFERAMALEHDRARLAQYTHAVGWIHLHGHRLPQSRAAFEKALELAPDLQGARDGLRALQLRGG